MSHNCYTCKFKGSIPGNAHLQCKHPKTGGIDDMRVLVAMLARRFGKPNLKIAKDMGVTLNDIGIKNGWAMFPFNFDPIWIESCNEYESNKQEA